MSGPRDKTRDTLNYFENPIINNDNRLVLDGTILINGQEFTALEFLNALQSGGTGATNPTSGFLPINESGAFVDSAISQAINEMAVSLRCVFIPSEVRIGSTGLRTIADVLYLQSSRTGRQFIPVGSLFDDTGTSNFMGIELGTLADQPNGSQLTSSDQMTITAGQSYAFLFPGQPNTDFLLGESVIRTSGAGEVRLQLFIGSDESGDLVIDQTYTLVDGDNTIKFDSIPLIRENQNYYAKYTAVTDTTILGLGVGTAFRPYFSARGWPYTEVIFFPTDDNEADNSHTLSAQKIYSEIDSRIQTAINNLAPNLPMPRFTSFSVDIAQSVSDGTQVTGSHTFTWTIEDAQNVKSGTTLTISETVPGGSKTAISTTVDHTLGTIDLTVSTTTLNEGDELIYTIEGTNTQNNTFSDTYTIRAPRPHEFAYYGVRPTNDFTTVDLSNLTSVDVSPSNTTYTINTSFPATEVLGILEPTDRPITDITNTVLNLPVLNRFDRTQNARTINGQSYDLLIEINNGPTGNINLEVTHG